VSVEIEKIVDVGIWRFSGDFRVHLNIIAFCAVFCANAMHFRTVVCVLAVRMLVVTGSIAS